ncbi:MAG: nitrite reductase small subunit NirD [Desertimonas sp.]
MTITPLRPRPTSRPLTLTWVVVCPVARLTPDRGVAALVDGRAVAVFRLADGSLHAIDNLDPCSGVSLLSRGIVGDAGGVVTVASPMYKQRFDLATGRCLDADVGVDVHDVHVIDGVVVVRLASPMSLAA